MIDSMINDNIFYICFSQTSPESVVKENDMKNKVC